MPLPIKKINDESNSCVDYSFLADYLEPKQASKKKVTASNKDARLLYELWDKGERLDGFTVKIPDGVHSKELTRLKAMGFLTGDLEKVSFTERGKVVITTMVLAEQNCFEKRRVDKKYTEILASMDKRGKAGYRVATQYAVHNNNRLEIEADDRTVKPQDNTTPKMTSDNMLNTFGQSSSSTVESKEGKIPSIMPDTLLNTFKGKEQDGSQNKKEV